MESAGPSNHGLDGLRLPTGIPIWDPAEDRC
jgi:hypothetical protein